MGRVKQCNENYSDWRGAPFFTNRMKRIEAALWFLAGDWPGSNCREVQPGMCSPIRVLSELEQALELISCSTPSERKAISFRGRNVFANNFSWEKIEKRLLGIYEGPYNGSSNSNQY